jgi:large subunit ribosomal protein L3
MKFLLAKKLGMTTVYTKERAENVTLLEAGENVVSQVRNQDKDGYTAVQVGIKDDSQKKTASKYLFQKEFRLNSEEIEGLKLESGSSLGVGQFSQGEKILIKGVTKGKGYQGVVKRHGFAGSPASHGHRHDLRAPGSIGSAFPERVLKGKKMAGRMGGNSAVVKNLRVVSVDEEVGILAVRGAVPGNNGSFVKIIG